MKSSQPRSTTRRVFPFLVGILFVVAVLHGRGAGAPLFEDERGSILHPHHLAELATGQAQQPFRPARTEADRPLARWGFRWLLPAEGAPPRALRRSALLLHLLTSGLLLFLFRRLGAGTLAAAWGVLLFALHPMVVEPLSWASALGMLTAGFFSTAALYAWLGGSGARMLALVLLALAIASHTAAAPIGLVFIALDVVRSRHKNREQLAPQETDPAPALSWPLLLPALVLGALGVLLASGGRDPVGGGARFLHAAEGVGMFLYHALIPAFSGALTPHPGLVAAVGTSATSGGQLAVAGGSWLVLAVLLGLGIRGLLRGERAALGWVWFVCLGLGAALPTPGSTLARDAASYLALPGLAFLCTQSLLAPVLRRWFLPGVVLGSATLLLCGALSWKRIDVWQSPLLVLERALEKSDQVEPGRTSNFVVETWLGQEYLWRGKLAAADAHFQSALVSAPNYAPALLGLGLHALHRDAREEARQYFKAALQIDPVQPRALERLAEVNVREGGRDGLGKATEYLRTAVELEPAFAHGHARLAGLLALLALGSEDERLSEAEEHARRALALAPDEREAWKALGEVHEKRGATALAIEAYERSLQSEPDYSEALFKLGSLRVELGDLTEGLALLERTFFLHPLEDHHAFALAEAYDRAGRTREAFEHYEWTVQKNPRHMRANEALGWLHLAAGEPAQALKRGEHLVGINPGHIGGRQILGHAQLQLELYGEALTNLRLAAASLPDNVQLGALVALLLASLPDAALRDGARALEAARELARATERRDAKVLQALAAAQAETGDFQSAGATIREALALPKDSVPRTLRKALESALASFERGEPLRLVSQSNAKVHQEDGLDR